MKHVHVYTRTVGSPYATCSCGHKQKLTELVYLGDAPRSVGNGSAWK